MKALGMVKARAADGLYRGEAGAARRDELGRGSRRVHVRENRGRSHGRRR
jgi:hypothetical protein